MSNHQLHSTDTKKSHRSWAMYDWANSVYSLIITSTFLPAYYIAVTSNESTNDNVHFLGKDFVNSSLYSYALAFSFLIIALISPLLSAIVDIKTNRKRFLIVFLSLGSIACTLLFFFTADTIELGIAMIMLSCIGYWGSLVFYNAYLPEIADASEMDKVSALGYKYGYIGSFILQVFCLLMVFKYDWFGFDNQSIATRCSFVLVGIWWFGFGINSIRKFPEKRHGVQSEIPTEKLIYMAYKNIFLIAKEAFQLILLRKFLLSYLFFNMGIQVVMLVATIYGAKELQIEQTYLIITIILIQLLAIFGASLGVFLSKKIGNFLTLFLLCMMWISVCIIAYFLPTGSTLGFCLIGAYVGVLMGGSQSLNRSTYSKIIPKTIFNTTYFSFYDVVEKISIVIGMVIFAYLEDLTGSMRNSVIAIIVFFVIGGYFLFSTYQRSKKQNVQLL